MTRETPRQKVYKALIGGVLAAVIALSSVGCLMTAFEFRVDWLPLCIVATVAAAAAGAVGFSFRYGPFAILGGVVLAAAALWRADWLSQIQSVITHLTYTYNQAYQWGVIRFSNAAWFEVDVSFALLSLAIVIALLVTWVTVRRRPLIVAIVAACVPLALCLVVTDTIPSAPCFFGLLVGVTILLVTSRARRQDSARAPVLTLIASVTVLALFAGLFHAVPQKGFRNPLMVQQNQLLTALGFEGYTAGTGEIDGIDLKGLGSRFFLQYPVLTVTSSEKGRVYLRERDYNIYTGYSWESDDKRADAFETQIPEGTQSHIAVSTDWTRSQLFVPYYPESHVLLGDGREWNSKQANSYEWDTRALPENWRDLVPNEMMFSDGLDMRYYYSLPTETQQWAHSTLMRILRGERSATAIADAVATYVRDSALYEDDCKRMPTSEDDFAKWFMTDGESGYCVHFATSTAVLLRAAGVPTRYVTGYLMDVEANEPTVVTADREHAWVEYYEPWLGMWIPLESTPEEIEEEEEPETTLPVTSTTESDLTTSTTRPIASDEDEVVGFVIPWKLIGTVALYVAVAVGSVAAVVFAVIGQRRWRLRRRQKRLDRCGANDRALLLWRHARRLCRRLKTSPSDAMYALAQKAKYSQHTLTDAELAVMQDGCRELETQLRCRPWYKRLIYVYVLCLY